MFLASMRIDRAVKHHCICSGPGPSGHHLNRIGVAIGGSRKWPIQRHWHLNNATVPGTAFGYAYHLDHIVRVIRLFLNAGQAIVDSATFGATATEIHVDPITANPHRALWMSKHIHLSGQSSTGSMSWGVFKIMLIFRKREEINRFGKCSSTLSTC